jgi:hypothetical protein
MSSPPQPETGPADDFALEQGAEFAIHLDTENEPPRTANDEDSYMTPEVLRELHAPPPPYERVSELSDDTDAMEEELQRYQLITSLLREALAGRASVFTEAEINLACGYMCSTTRDNLAAALARPAEQGAQFFARYNRALFFFKAAVEGADTYWEHVLSQDEARLHGTASSVIEFLLVTHILLPRMQGLIDFVDSLASLHD